MKPWRVLVLFLFLIIPLGFASAQAEEPALNLRLRRTFGYQAGDRIQGSFSLEVTGIEDITSVDYLLDGDILVTATEEPFRASFSTGNYPPGEHTLRALATSSNGGQFESQTLHLVFITAEQGWQSAGRIAAWILGGTLVVMVVGMLGTGYLSRGKRHFKPGVYGVAGGAVCGRCQLPFSRHVLAPNLLVGKLERCPHCGKIALVPRAAQSSLDEAEARFNQDLEKGQRRFDRAGEEFKRRLDDSRFEG